MLFRSSPLQGCLQLSVRPLDGGVDVVADEVLDEAEGVPGESGQKKANAVLVGSYTAEAKLSFGGEEPRLRGVGPELHQLERMAAICGGANGGIAGRRWRLLVISC